MIACPICQQPLTYGSKERNCCYADASMHHTCWYPEKQLCRCRWTLAGFDYWIDTIKGKPSVASLRRSGSGQSMVSFDMSGMEFDHGNPQPVFDKLNCLLAFR